MTSLAHWLVKRTLSADRARLPIAVLRRVPGLRALLRDRSLDGWRRRHPFDELHGTDTAYAGCAPGIVRRILERVPDSAATTFLDLGCGKGRALIVATEFGFRSVIGVELSPDLCRAARANAEIVAARFPERAAIEIVRGDAVEYVLPDGPLAIFLYHPFHRILMQRLADRLAADGAERSIHVLYCNAVFADVFDRSPGFTPVFSGTMSCDPGERGYAAADEEPVAIWRR
jgi:SAM-dependent methyltransferase